MRSLLFFFVLLFTSSAFGFSVEIAPSKMTGLFEFARAVTNVPHTSEVIRTAWKSWPQNEATRAALESFSKSYASLERSFESRKGGSRGLLSGGGDSIELESLFRFQVAQASKLTDLERGTAGMMPPVEHQELIRSLRLLEPVYEVFVWNKNRVAIREYAKRFNAGFKRWRGAELLDAAAAFYGTRWPESLPFSVALHPLPGRQGVSEAESLSHLQVVSVFAGASGDISRRHGILVHEICHSFFREMDRVLRESLEAEFRAGAGVYGWLAAQYLDEALATAIGNGVAQGASGAAEDKSWYDDPVIDKYARDLFPLVKSYLAAKKRMDAAFVREAAERFKVAFPDAPQNLDMMFSRQTMVVLDASTMLGSYTQEMWKQFSVSSMYSLPLPSREDAEEMEKGFQTSIVLVLPRAHLNETNVLEAKIPEFRKLREAMSANQLAAAMPDAKGRVLVLIEADGFAQGIAELRKRGKIEATGVTPFSVSPSN